MTPPSGGVFAVNEPESAQSSFADQPARTGDTSQASA